MLGIMNKAGVVLGAVIIILAIGGAAYTISRTYHPAPSVSPGQTGTGNAAVGANGTSVIITYTDAGFAPSPLTVAVGTTVTWSNQSSHPLWVEATGPAGGDCANAQAHTTLDECQTVSSGGTYSYTFTKLGTVSYFNHERASDTGIITVSDTTSAGPINPNAVPE